MFKKTSQQRIFEDLVSQIEGAILDGRLKTGGPAAVATGPGGHVPDQPGAPFGRRCVCWNKRDSWTSSAGYAVGAVVKRPGMTPVAESLGLLVRHRQITLAELSEFREGVEGNVAAIASQRANPADIRQLRELLGQSKKHVDAGVDAGNDFARWTTAFMWPSPRPPATGFTSLSCAWSTTTSSSTMRPTPSRTPSLCRKTIRICATSSRHWKNSRPRPYAHSCKATCAALTAI